MSGEDPLFYRLDDKDRIVDVGGAWDRFALDNEGADAQAARVVGTPLFKHVSGEASRMFVWTVLDVVRKTRNPRNVEYRCDSPDCRRHMEMVITPVGAKDLMVEHRVRLIEPTARSPRFVVPPRGTRAPLLIRCSMCNAVRIARTWLDTQQAIEQGKLDPAVVHHVAYGVCGSCRMRAGRAISR